ncbi:hypothetical protein M422DRAFT_180814, partial [Sphaerobolus stellatus SS14]
LQVFNKATLRMSQADTALLHQVIPVIDMIRTALENITSNDKLMFVVRHAARNGFQIIDKYYSLTDNSEMYRVAMIMHPSYKTAYFDKMKWEATWKTTAVDIVRRIWRDRYLPRISSQTMVSQEVCVCTL